MLHLRHNDAQITYRHTQKTMVNHAEIAALKWDVRQRLTLLESTLLLTGWVRTQALVETFSISRAQASKDFAVYMNLRPDNLKYNKSLKYYEAGDTFTPLLLTGSATDVLNALQVVNPQQTPVVTLAAALPAIQVVQPLDRQLDWSVLRVVSQAICQKRKLKAAYQSMNRNEPTELTLSPHHLVFSGFRWHVRAFSDTHQAYRDFVLARFRGEAPQLLNETAITGDHDEAWHQTIDVIIEPHPGLPESQRMILSEDYGMIDGTRCEPVRQALLPYFLRMMQIEPERQHPDPKIQQIILKNPEQIQPFLWSNSAPQENSR